MRRNGIVLILIAGLLTLLAAAGMAFARFALQIKGRSLSQLDRAQARLLAHSGLAYATARLFQDPAPADPRTADNQPDDWTFRDGATVSLDECRNPSYAHGEPYLDVDKNGRYDQGLDTLLDLDFDGRRDLWSGRLRGRGAPDGATFDLKIETESGKIDINGGMLSATDVDQNGVLDCRDVVPPPAFHPPPRQSLLTYTPLEPRRKNLRVADTINLLEQATFDYGTAPVTPAVNPLIDSVNGTTQQLGLRNALPYRAIGTKLIQNRPPGGYVDLDQAYKTAFPANSPQDREAWDRIKPYLSTRHIAKRMTWGPGFSYKNPADPAQAIDLNAAAKPLLQALNTGLQINYTEQGYLGTLLTVGLNDAGRVADLLAAQRPFASRYDLFSKLCAARAELFPRDTPTGQNQKLNLVAENMEGARDWDALYGNDNPITFPLLSWITYDLPRLNGSKMKRCTWWGDGLGNEYSRLPPPVPQDVAPGFPYDGYNKIRFATLPPLSLERFGTGVFSTQSLGRVREGSGKLSARSSATGTVALDKEIAAFSQCHFENEEEIRSETNSIHYGFPFNAANPFPYWATLFRFQLRSLDRSRGEPALHGRPRKLCTQSFPGFPLDSCPDFDQSVEHVPLQGIPYTQYIDTNDDLDCNYPWYSCYRGNIGKVALMTYTGRRYGDEFFYQPCWEKGQPLRNPLSPETAADNFREAGGSSPDLRVISYPPIQAIVCSSLSITPTTMFKYPNADFPWFKQGAFKQGSLDFWSIGGYCAVEGKYYNSFKKRWETGGEFACAAKLDGGALTLSINGESAKGVRSYAIATFHRVTATLTESGSEIASVVYADGIPDPGLTNSFSYKTPQDPLFIGTGRLPVLSIPTLQPAGTRGVRVFGTSLDPFRAQAMGLEPAFWNGELETAAPGVPSYTSPLYVFQGDAILNGVSWDGFVPEQIRGPSELAGKTPLRVELLVYPDALGKDGTETVIPIPEEQWRTGGGHLDLQELWRRKHGALLRAHSLRYRVWMDNSAVGGSFSNETPVFDSIRIYYGSARFLSASE